VGLLGFFLLMMILGLWVMGNIIAQQRTRDPLIKALLVGTLASLGGIWLQYLTFSTLYIMHIWFLIGYGVALQKLATAGTLIKK
jgi:hypothetical protein